MLYNKSAVKNRIPITPRHIKASKLVPIFEVDEALKKFFEEVFKPKGKNDLEKVLHLAADLSRFITYDHKHDFKGIRTTNQTICDTKGHCLEQNSALYTLLRYQGIKTNWVIMKNPKGFKAKLEDVAIHPFLKFQFNGKDYLADQVSRGVYLFNNEFWYAAKQEMSDREFISLCLIIGGEDVSKTHKQPEKAIAYFRAALTVDPNNYPAYVFMADSLVSSGKLKQAKQAIKKATEMTPGLADLYKTWGDILLDAENYKEAIRAYSQASEMNSQDFQLLYTLEKRLYELGKHSEKRKVYEKRNRLTKSRPSPNSEMILLGINRSGNIKREIQNFHFSENLSDPLE